MTAFTPEEIDTILQGIEHVAERGMSRKAADALIAKVLGQLGPDSQLEAADAIASLPHGGAGAARAKRAREKQAVGIVKPADQPMPEFEPPSPEHVKVEKSDGKLTPERRASLQKTARQLEQFLAEEPKA